MLFRLRIVWREGIILTKGASSSFWRKLSLTVVSSPLLEVDVRMLTGVSVDRNVVKLSEASDLLLLEAKSRFEKVRSSRDDPASHNRANFGHSDCG